MILAADDGKWLSQRCDCKTTGFFQASADISAFFTAWGEVNDELYNESVKPNKRRNTVRKLSHSAARVYRDYMRFGLRAGSVFEENPRIAELSQ